MHPPPCESPPNTIADPCNPDVLNRHVDLDSVDQTAHILKYIFPRQHGLHNVFTSPVDPRETAQPFKDYTMREHEIALVDTKPATNSRGGAVQRSSPARIPKRLRGQVFDLVAAFRRRHAHCSYFELLHHYCSVPDLDRARPADANYGRPDSRSQVIESGSQKVRPAVVDVEQCSFTDLATHASSVSAFVRAVILKVIPHRFFGDGEVGIWNKRVVLRYIDQFMSMRKYESLTLHELMQEIKVSSKSCPIATRTEC